MTDQNDNQTSKTIELTPYFKLIFISLLGLTIFCFAICLYLSFQDPPNIAQTKLFGTCETMMQMGFGAIVGLIGGKRV